MGMLLRRYHPQHPPVVPSAKPVIPAPETTGTKRAKEQNGFRTDKPSAKEK